MTITHRTRHWLPLLPLFGLVGVTYWLNQQAQPNTAKLNSAKYHDPDAIMENFSAIRLNEQGKPRFIMVAKKLLHYPDDDSTLLEVPHMTLLTDRQPAIHITAAQGIISSKGDDMFMHNNVVVLREASAMQDELAVHTEYLHVSPDREWAYTDRAVTIVDAHNTVHANGLEIDNKARTLKLLSQVRSEHVPGK